MLINGVEYELVEKGSLESMAYFGIVIGALLVLLVVMFYYIGRRNMFKKYYRQINDEEVRKNVVGSIKRVADDVDALAGQTNTLFFKSMANEFNLLICELRKRQ
jgi:hypothetical protein